MYAGALLYGVTHGMSWKQAGHLASHASARGLSSNWGRGFTAASRRTRSGVSWRELRRGARVTGRGQVG